MNICAIEQKITALKNEIEKYNLNIKLYKKIINNAKVNLEMATFNGTQLLTIEKIPFSELPDEFILEFNFIVQSLMKLAIGERNVCYKELDGLENILIQTSQQPMGSLN